MKQILFRALEIVAQVIAFLTACIGCTKSTSEPVKPREIHWHGHETNFHSTTIVPPVSTPNAALRD